MKQYMVICNLPPFPDEEFMSLVPAQRVEMERLMQNGYIMNFSLSANFQNLWITMLGNTEHDIIKILKKFPMIKFFNYHIQELMLNVTFAKTFPILSMN